MVHSSYLEMEQKARAKRPNYIVERRHEQVHQVLRKLSREISGGMDAKSTMDEINGMHRVFEPILVDAFNAKLPPGGLERLQKAFDQGGQAAFELILTEYFPFDPPRYDAVLEPALKELRARYVSK